MSALPLNWISDSDGASVLTVELYQKCCIGKNELSGCLKNTIGVILEVLWFFSSFTTCFSSSILDVSTSSLGYVGMIMSPYFSLYIPFILICLSFNFPTPFAFTTGRGYSISFVLPFRWTLTPPLGSLVPSM